MTDDSLLDAPLDATEKLAKESAAYRRKLTMLRQAIPSDTWAEIIRSHYHMTKWFDKRREAR